MSVKYDPILVKIIQRFQPILYLKALEEVTGISMQPAIDKYNEELRELREKEEQDANTVPLDAAEQSSLLATCAKLEDEAQGRSSVEDSRQDPERPDTFGT